MSCLALPCPALPGMPLCMHCVTAHTSPSHYAVGQYIEHCSQRVKALLGGCVQLWALSNSLERVRAKPE
eukprot:9040006-Alexandrium_andersonii.AAC.1